mgnify:CR=1 FL=1
MLFSEPKIPQLCIVFYLRTAGSAFQCSSASRKFLNCGDETGCDNAYVVSVLFSEPKIPQRRRHRREAGAARCFSALQRAENSSTGGAQIDITSNASFSALQRAENSSTLDYWNADRGIARFSALQRAENSSTKRVERATTLGLLFQCSSASRKFLNTFTPDRTGGVCVFQCSSASRKFLNGFL